jgi:hypothetical protein
MYVHTCTCVFALCFLIRSAIAGLLGSWDCAAEAESAGLSSTRIPFPLDVYPVTGLLRDMVVLVFGF